MKRERAGGINVVEALLEHAPERVVRVWLKPAPGRLEALAERGRAAGVAVERAGEAALDRLAGDRHHQGAVAEFVPAPALDEGDLDALVAGAGEKALLLMLDQVQDPHNLGACMRSAAAAGADAVIIPRARSAPLTPAARRAAAGAAETLPLVVVANLARCLARLGEAGLRRVGLAGQGETSLYAADLTGPLVLVAGAEDKGLRRLTRERCDVLAAIPMAKAVESLNVSVSAAIALFEARRQRAGAEIPARHQA